jgi:hypothetical protein
VGAALKGHNHFPASRSLPNIVNDQPDLPKGKRGLVVSKPEPPGAKPVPLLFLLAARYNASTWSRITLPEKQGHFQFHNKA